MLHGFIGIAACCHEERHLETIAEQDEEIQEIQEVSRKIESTHNPIPVPLSHEGLQHH